MLRRIGSYRFMLNGIKTNIIFEKYPDLQKINDETKYKLKNEINDLLTKSWGTFPSDFIDGHIFGTKKILIARVKERCVGFCVTSIKIILGIKINYIELLVVDTHFQKSKIGSQLFFRSIKEEILKNILHLLLGKSLEIVFITPNIRTLAHMARFASFIYPNPYLADEKGSIGLADDETWIIANELIKNSDNPGRKLERNGLVLHQSYVNTPWLIYNNDNAPWHGKEKINTFAKRYLGYHTGEDREFVVRAHINFLSFIRYILYA